MKTHRNTQDQLKLTVSHNIYQADYFTNIRMNLVPYFTSCLVLEVVTKPNHRTKIWD